MNVCLGILYFDNLLTSVSVEPFQYLTFISLLIMLLLSLLIKMIITKLMLWPKNTVNFDSINKGAETKYGDDLMETQYGTSSEKFRLLCISRQRNCD